MEIKLGSGDNMSQSHSKLVKNFITDAEMTEILPFKYSRDLKSGHPKSGHIPKPDKFVSGFQIMVAILFLPFENRTGRF